MVPLLGAGRADRHVPLRAAAGDLPGAGGRGGAGRAVHGELGGLDSTYTTAEPEGR